MRTYLTLLLLAAVIAVKAQTNYSVSQIAASLLTHANAVVRDDETTITVKSIDGATEDVKYVVTVLNESGEKKAKLSLYYNRGFETIRSVKGFIYDEYGKISGKFSESDFTDRAVYDGYSLYEDGRIKYYYPAVTHYPYTVEYDYTINLKQTADLDAWRAIDDWNTAVERSSYQIKCTPDFGIRYKETNYTGTCSIAEQDGLKTYTWEANNIKALRSEPNSPDFDKIVPSVRVAPNQFNYGGIKGSFTNWQEFGSFMYDKLLKDRRALPPETITYVKALTADITDPKMKAKKIYEYVQQKTRYVSIDVGIGGIQPFTATEVDNTSYGDCKALVNYTQALLDAVGVPSWYVLNQAGSDKQSALRDFASMDQFDHVILCMPFKNDTTWVDCTSKELPFGYLGDFTDDRDVVACTPNGGILLHTPKYTAEASKQTRTATFNIDANGTLKGQMQTLFTGVQYDNRNDLINEAFSERVKKLGEIYPIQNLYIESYKLDQDKSLNPKTTEIMTLRAPEFMAANGDRFFITPNAASRYIRPKEDMLNRTQPVYINRGYHDEDNIEYTLPAGFTLTNKPLNLSIEKPFAKYSVSMQLNGNKLVYKRMFQLNDGTWSKDTYADLVDFYQTVYEADNYSLSFQKQ